ncbi:Uncharacterised protein [Klebsiella oxytoca]|nr:Uncharacterised protein [Klebsiella oxytoca]
MRMSLMFAAVTLLTGINLFFIPFQPVPALWGAILAVAFVLINVVADIAAPLEWYCVDYRCRHHHNADAEGERAG